MLKGLYIHIPFCNKKCNYCSFYSSSDLTEISPYLSALKEEVEIKKRLYPNFFDNKEATLYIGGGNPAILDIDQMQLLLKYLYSLNFDFIEITIEANPDSLTEQKLELYKDMGVNRLSLGMQSFDDRILTVLGRNHKSYEAKRAAEMVKKYFNNFSIDLIGGIDGFYRGEHVRRDIEKDIKELENINPPHISFYLLSVEKGTPFYDSYEVLEEKQISDYEFFISFARDKGYIHYEISSYSKAGFECLHNQLYWERKDYLGFGASAASYLGKDREIRIKNISDIKEYIKNPASFQTEQLKAADILFEMVFLPLRTKRGLFTDTIKESFPSCHKSILKNLNELKKAGFLEEENGKWSIREEKYLISNEIILEILKGAEI